jgi:Sulfatase-modifying factor enzyme 1
MSAAAVIAASNDASAWPKWAVERELDLQEEFNVQEFGSPAGYRVAKRAALARVRHGTMMTAYLIVLCFLGPGLPPPGDHRARGTGAGGKTELGLQGLCEQLLGLYDMHGNVWEWVEDSWHGNYDGAPTDGSAWLRGGDSSYRVIRGGSWRNDTGFIRAAVRVKRTINVQFDTLGFRVARSLNR